MASILRSAKFVRYVAGFARNIVINPPREFDGNLIQNTQCLCGGLQRSLATQASTQHVQPDQTLDRSLRRLDQDVRRSGRISRRDIEDILEEIRHTRSATSSQSLLVIRCCGNLVPEELPETRTKLVQEIWNTLLKLNVPMDISHYNALLRVYLENEHPFSPTDFLVDLESKGIEPNRVTYQRLISRYCQLGDIEGATRILEFMREKQLPVNENVFNALIMGHSQTDDMESAKGILSVMQQAGLEPSADTYTTLLSGYARTGDIDSLKEIIDECEAKEIYLLDKDYLDVIFSLSVHNHNEHVPYILSKIRKSVGYNQDATNLILRLINYAQEDTALQILRTIPIDVSSAVSSSNFLIRQMVKANRSVDKILALCKHMEEEQLCETPLLYAVEMSLQIGNDKLAYALLTELHKSGQTVKQHFFWPLIVAKGKRKDERAILQVLEQMLHYDLIPSNETVREYVLPYMSGRPNEIIPKLQKLGLSVASIANCLLYKYLMDYKIKEAADTVYGIPAYYLSSQIRRPLTNAFLRTNDLDSYLKIIRTIHDNFDRRDMLYNKEESEEPATKLDKTDLIGVFVLELINTRRASLELIETVLSGLVRQGLSMSNKYAQKIQEKLDEKLTPEISNLLSKMTSGELSPVPLEKPESVHYTPPSAMSIPQLERLIANLEAKGETVKGYKRQLLTLYTRERELEKTEKLLEELKNSGFIFTAGIYAQLIELYASQGKLDEALEYYRKFRELEPDTAIDNFKVMRVVDGFIRKGQFDEAISFINQQTEGKRNEDSFNYVALCWRTLNYLAEQGKADEVKTLFDTLMQKDLVGVTNMILGPLIKVHILNNDMQKAMEEFENCCIKYRCTPWKNELTCKLIQSEDAENLQKLTDLSTNIHGEVNSLYDLVFAFVECGRIRQARRILETPGLQKKPQRLSAVCEKYQEEGKVKPLEGLMEATRDISHIDRGEIYYQLLLSYIKQTDAEKALGLWTQMQEEDVQPTEDFLTLLGTFLQEQKVPVPFVMPSGSAQTPAATESSKTNHGLFRHALKSGQTDEALRLRNKTGMNLSAGNSSLLLESLVKEDRLSEATKLCIDMLEKNMSPMPRVFRFFLNKVANSGDVDRMERIGSKLSSEDKKILSFDNRLCHANIVAGKAADYLDILMKEIDHAKDDQVSILAEKFPRGGAIGILEKCRDLIPKYELLAEKFVKRGVIAPMNVLWVEHFINNDTESANRIWSTYLSNTPRIMFQRIVHSARENKNEDLIRRLVDHLKTSKVSEGAIGNAYSCLLDVLVTLGKEDQVVNTIEQAIKDVNIEFINRTALLRVKEVYQKLGKAFPHQIPQKNAKSSSSSSSSSPSPSSNDEAKKP